MSNRSARASALIRSSFAAHRPRISFLCPRCSSQSDALNAFTPKHYPPARRRRPQSTLAAAVSAAQQIFNGNIPERDSPTGVDPLRGIAREMRGLTKNIRQLLGSGHSTLDTVAKYYTQAEGKHVRPMLVYLTPRKSGLRREEVVNSPY